ncbi:hypothetical protein FNH43_12980 [Salmonella enterica subsp. salamae]|nr:hypothetical protein [Salmonella enterica subsp. salamae]
MRERVAEAVKEVLEDYEINKKADPAHKWTHFYNMEEGINNIRKVLVASKNISDSRDIKELDQMMHLLRNGKVPTLPEVMVVQS